MAEFSVSLARSARKELERLPDTLAGRIFEKIEGLAINPRPSGVTKIHGQRSLWRIRVSDYRVVYSIDDASRTVDVSVIRHRRDVYRDL